MRKGLFRMSAVGLGIAVSGISAAPAFAAAPQTFTTSEHASLAATPIATATCAPAAVSEAFSSFGDANEYSIVPGESSDDFAGAGWTLSGGAKIVTTTLADGSQGEALDVPSGGNAVSPPMCITNADPTARSMFQNVAGGGGVQMYVSYATSNAWGSFQGTGSLNGGSMQKWQPSPVLYINPSNQSGWQLARFAIVGGGGSGNDTRVYNFYVDPRMCH